MCIALDSKVSDPVRGTRPSGKGGVEPELVRYTKLPYPTGYEPVAIVATMQSLTIWTVPKRCSGWYSAVRGGLSGA